MRRFIAFPVLALIISACGDATGPEALREKVPPLSASASSSGFTLVDLGVPGTAHGINDAGQVVGESFADAFLWEAGTGISYLGTLGGYGSKAYDINNVSQVVGYSGVSGGPGGPSHAFLWEASAGMTDLGSLGGISVAFGVNARAQVVGYSTPGFSAFLWEAGTGMVNFGALMGIVGWSWAFDINDAGHVVGRSYVGGILHAYLWGPTTGLTDLGTLGGADSRAWGVNNFDQVVGVSATSGGESHAFMWEAGTGMTDLGTLGGDYSEARAINDAGKVVGISTTAAGEQHAFIWQAGHGMTDLGTPGTRSEAHDVNSSGTVAGRSGSNAVVWLTSRLTVEIDIKPGSEANPINLKSKGVVPVAVLGSDAFDVYEIDRSTLTLGPSGAMPVHEALGHLDDINDDGYLDLVSHYRQRETGLSYGNTETCVTGSTLGGTPFEGCDAVRIL